MSESSETTQPSFREALRFWIKLGFISFGGPTGQIAIMHEELVERRKWIDEQRFLHALNYCMLLPGPEAQQLATYIGWLLHGARGGIVAGAFFVLPSIVILWALSWIYMAHGTLPWIAAVFVGLQPAVIAIVAQAAIRIGKKALKNWVMYAVAASAFVAIHFFDVAFPWIVLGAATIGFAGGRLSPAHFSVIQGHGGKQAGAFDAGPPPTWRRAFKVIALCGALWWTPVLIAGLVQGWDGVLVEQGTFFSKAAMVTFGGAYAVLPYVGQAAVERYGWLSSKEMLDGLGLAETTPGPLIMVLQFVGFLGGWRNSGALPPWLGATLSALMTTWVTFLPCFLWIFLGAPYIERLRSNPRLSAVLSSITAAVVGVVLNLAVWFATEVLFPGGEGVDLTALAIAVGAFACLQWLRWNVVTVVLCSALIGLVIAGFQA